ncbi:hypothetical protein KOW79_003811 [Hemibagrus wyckioides]|uniref:Uncharacterized protein n=1 Tax=Hemibagrus wyckioides TaxID=337641 RepID=A0A9D3P0G3_9TELE|nr:hypothetical protein KOW79_003811 [Hemibagrus wyckioides]
MGSKWAWAENGQFMWVPCGFHNVGHTWILEKLKMKISISAKNRSSVCAPVFNNSRGNFTVNCFTKSQVDMNFKYISEEPAEPQAQRIGISLSDGSSLCCPVAYNCRGTLTINYYSQYEVLEEFNSEETAEPQAQTLLPSRGGSAPFSPSELTVNISADYGSTIYSPVYNDCTGTLTINFFGLSYHRGEAQHLFHPQN